MTITTWVLRQEAFSKSYLTLVAWVLLSLTECMWAVSWRGTLQSANSELMNVGLLFSSRMRKSTPFNRRHIMREMCLGWRQVTSLHVFVVTAAGMLAQSRSETGHRPNFYKRKFIYYQFAIQNFIHAISNNLAWLRIIRLLREDRYSSLDNDVCSCCAIAVPNHDSPCTRYSTIIIVN